VRAAALTSKPSRRLAFALVAAYTLQCKVSGATDARSRQRRWADIFTNPQPRLRPARPFFAAMAPAGRRWPPAGPGRWPPRSFNFLWLDNPTGHPLEFFVSWAVAALVAGAHGSGTEDAGAFRGGIIRVLADAMIHQGRRAVFSFAGGAPRRPSLLAAMQWKFAPETLWDAARPVATVL